MKPTRTDRLLYALIYALLTLALVLVMYPLYFIVISSISDPVLVNLGKVWWKPESISLDGYARVIDDMRIWTGYLNSLAYAVAGTSLQLCIVLLTGFAMSRRELKGRGVIMGYFAFTMFFGGGLIPTYLLIRDLKLLDTFWVMILPGAVSVYNMIIVRTFFTQNIPEELWDASQIDGCSYFRYFLRIVLPLSGAVVAVMVLFFAVGHWNAYFKAMIYLSTEKRYPLQLILRSILLGSQLTSEMAYDDEASARAYALAESMKYAIIIVSSVPVLILYPFIQKHFTQGVMVGAIKG